MALIEIEGMEFYAFHGHFEVEKIAGNRFVVNLKIESDCSKAGKSDKLEDTLDYQKAFLAVREEMAVSSDLLEHVCQRIIQRIKTEFQEIQKVTVKVSKMNPPMGGQIEKVSVTMEG
ncbi:MAG: dihydroneopterin aldolase [Bacteroidia bacterium]